MKIAVLSDTHGLLRPEILTACEGADHILHAGDVGDPAILEKLAAVASVTAIRGNIDTHGPCANLPAVEWLEVGGLAVYMVHAFADLDLNPQAVGIDVVISGHSHRFAEEHRDSVLYLNPGSAGPRRFRLPVSMAYLHAGSGSLRVERKEFAI